MDIHPPGGSIHSLRDYLLHLSMVVLGIVIALGLDGLREVWHERALVRHSVEAMRSEVQYNRDFLSKAITNYDQSRVAVQGIVRLIEARQHQQPVDDAALTRTLNLAIPPLNSGAWQAAVTTQALAHMDYPQAQLWSSAYAFQNQVQLLQNDWISVYGRLSLLGRISDDESPEQLQQQMTLAREVLQRIDMTQFVWRVLIKHYDTALSESAAG